MDINGLPVEGFPSLDLTVGYGIAPLTVEPGVISGVAVTDNGVRARNGLSETEKEHIILECKDAGSDREVEKILEDRVPDEEMGRFLDSALDNIY